MFATRIMPVIWLAVAAASFHRGDDTPGYALLACVGVYIIAMAIMDDYYEAKRKGK